MAYFPDLSPYGYGNSRPEGVLHVGWLDSNHTFAQGHVPQHLIDKIKTLAEHPVELYRGYHMCELCVRPTNLDKRKSPDRIVIDPMCEWARWTEARRSNGEIRVGVPGRTFAAPVLIIHYIEAHAYLPPAAFLEAVEAATI